MTEKPQALKFNNQLLVRGSLLAAIGAAISMVGMSAVGVAVLSALRQWNQSEQRRELTAKARAASKQAATAAAAAWREEHARTITMPDARSAAQPSVSR